MAFIFFLQVFYADTAVDTAWCYQFFRKTHLNPPYFMKSTVFVARAYL
jgi:hypothetical protein